MTKIKLRPISDEEEARIQAGIALDPDAPEMTDEQLANMRPAREVLPASFFEGIEQARRSRGRPKLDDAKIAVTLRIAPDVLDAFKSKGEDWRNRMTDVLRKEAGL